MAAKDNDGTDTAIKAVLLFAVLCLSGVLVAMVVLQWSSRESQHLTPTKVYILQESGELREETGYLTPDGRLLLPEGKKPKRPILPIVPPDKRPILPHRPGSLDDTGNKGAK